MAFAAEPARFCVAGDNRGHMGFTQVAQKIKEAPGAPLQFIIFTGDKDLGTARGGTNDTFLNEDWKAFWAVLEEQGVAAYICSHTHRYSRFRPPGSKVWQIDVAQARGDASWQNDAFVIVTAAAQSLEFQTYRNLKEKGKFEVTDGLSLKAAGVR